MTLWLRCTVETLWNTTGCDLWTAKCPGTIPKYQETALRWMSLGNSYATRERWARGRLERNCGLRRRAIVLCSKELLCSAPKSYCALLQRVKVRFTKETAFICKEYGHFWDPLCIFCKRAFVFKISDRPSNFEDRRKSKDSCKVELSRVDCATARLQTIIEKKVVSKVPSRPHTKKVLRLKTWS